MNLKVGDKVKIRIDLSERKYGKINACKEMCQFAGKIVTVRKLYGESFDIQEDTTWFWSEEMIESESIIQNFTKANLKMGMVVEYRNGDRGIFLEDIFLGKTIGIFLNAFTDTLEYGMKTIDKVYISSAPSLDEYFNDKYLELIWEKTS